VCACVGNVEIEVGALQLLASITRSVARLWSGLCGQIHIKLERTLSVRDCQTHKSRRAVMRYPDVEGM
jgi:hypothetical protein